MNRYLYKMFSVITVLALMLMALPMQLAGAAAPGDVVINEIMQNPNAVFDSAGEWFELYNPTGSDIDMNGWTIKDNGTDNHVINNGGPLLIPAGGYLVLGNNSDTATNGGVTVDYNYGASWFLANGDDEVVLLDNSLVEIDRVEYDGGPTFPDPTGASMALFDPSLDNNDGANWCTSSTSFGAGDLGTPGAANDCGGTSVVEVVINEIMQNPNAVFDSAGEWFELYNAGSSDVDVNGWTIEDNDIDSHVISNGGPLIIPAGGYIVLGNNSDSGTNGGVTVNYNYGGSWFLANGADEVVLLDSGSIEIDRVEYDDGFSFPDPTGASMALSDPSLDNNVGANWCTASTPYGAGDLGTPGAANDCGATSAAEILINEIMQNPNAVFDNAGEWFELYNAGSTDVDINGWTIADNDFDSHVIANGGPLLIPAGGYLVLGNNADTATNGGVTVDYSYGGDWFLANGADEVILMDGGSEVDRVEYDDGFSFPDPTGASMALSDPSLDNNDGANWCTSSTPFGAGDLGTPGGANICAPAVLAVKIHEVQGSGATSPLVGNTVVVEGIVVGDFQDGSSGTNGDLNGFFVQEEDADTDTDPLTSEGIFVFDGNSPAVNVAIGDLVQIEGDVSEFNGLTEITSFSGVTVTSSGNPLPTATNLSLPVTSRDDFEAYEGMYVTFPQALVISEYFNFDRFNEVVLTADRQFQPTAVYEPGSPGAAALALANSLSRITLDDGRTIQNPDPAIHPNGMEFTLSNRFRGGDTVENVTGVMHYAFDLYRIQPTEGADYSSENPRTNEPEDVGGSLKVASFNVLNYFLTLDDGTNDICGPLQNQECRGADTAEEFERQQAKIMSALSAIDADVFGLIEMENTTGVEPLADIVAGLNDDLGAGTYAFIDTGTIGSDAIKVGIIYKPATVTPVGSYAILDSSVDPRFDDDRSRPVLAQSFQENATGGVFTVAVNHLKSKGSACGPGDDDPQQGNCNLTRTLAAQALVDWLESDPTGSGDIDFLITGDLNSYDKEEPIDAILEGSDDALGTIDDYTDLLYHFIGEFAYSFVFDGQLGYLDHALASSNLLHQVTGATVWHINADEPDLIDYDTSFKGPNQDAIYAPDAYRSSDHDPVIVGLNLTHYDFTGFFPPVANPPTVNTANAGAVIPIRFNLNGDQGLDVFADGYPALEFVSCDTFTPDGSETTVTAGGAGLHYDPALDEYTYTWKTSKNWAGMCGRLLVIFDDGMTYTALFEFTK